MSASNAFLAGSPSVASPLQSRQRGGQHRVGAASCRPSQARTRVYARLLTPILTRYTQAFLGDRLALRASPRRQPGQALCSRTPALAVTASAVEATGGTPVKSTSMLVVGATGTLGRQARSLWRASCLWLPGCRCLPARFAGRLTR